MCVGSPTAGAWSSFQRRPDDEFETDTSYGLMLTEAAVVAMASRLVGYDPARAAGVFTFGGTGTVLYGCFRYQVLVKRA